MLEIIGMEDGQTIKFLADVDRSHCQEEVSPHHIHKLIQYNSNVYMINDQLRNVDLQDYIGRRGVYKKQQSGSQFSQSVFLYSAIFILVIISSHHHCLVNDPLFH